MLTVTTKGFDQLPDSFIESVKNACDIVDVVGQYVQLKPAGRNLFGLCPFHGEKSPSFSVSPAKQMYHCFGCGLNGDAIKFLMEHGALSFREAVIELAERARIPLPSSDASRPAPPDLSGLVRINELAGAFFRHCLRYTDKAKEYVRSRQIPPEAARRFVIGYAPEGWQSLQEAFPDTYKTSTQLLELGLVTEKNERRYDSFRDRLMFGIRDARGRLIGWGGRSISDNEPKYLNSPQSSLFDKSSQLFGIYEAREAIRKTHQVIVTEGYIDTVANAMAGLPQTVATMGTACTEAHLERLVALAPEVIFCFDGDKAGLAAAWKALKTCLPFATDERSFRFLVLPDNMDPDELIQSRGAQAYQDLINEAPSLSGFILAQLAQIHGGLQTGEQRAQYLKDGQSMIQQMPQGNLRRIVREALIASSAMSPAEIQVMSGNSLRKKPSSTVDVWGALAEAATMQPATAERHAEEIIAKLSPEMQEAFFSSGFHLFPANQQAFWKAMDAAIMTGESEDQEGDIAMAQRDLLANAALAIERQLQREARSASLSEFRAGKSSEEAFLARLSQRPGEP